MKHLPFQSIYRENFEVVEQRIGREYHFPHDDQLPIIWRALDMEFRDKLPGRFARVDHRADGFHKVVRRMAALLYAGWANVTRPDGLRLVDLMDPHLVSQVGVVQRITRCSKLGRAHSFRFYGGPEFQPELRLSGKRVSFADHVLERFSQRVPNRVGEDLMNLIMAVYGSPILSMQVDWGRALVVAHGKSLLAFTYKETAEEIFLTTCLTVKELGSLKAQNPPLIYNWHYGTSFTPPKIRNWVPTEWMKGFVEAWQKKTPLERDKATEKQEPWHAIAPWVKDAALRQGHGPGSRLVFTDGIPGPCVIAVKAGNTLLEHDELAEYKRTDPDKDWDRLFAQRDRLLRGECNDNKLQP